MPADDRWWGVIRYAPGSRTYVDPDADLAAAFDGWYRNRQDAVDVFEYWCERFKGWTIALIQEVDIQRGGMFAEVPDARHEAHEEGDDAKA